MNIKRKKILVFLVAFGMIFSSINFKSLKINKVHAEETENVQVAMTVNDGIKAVIDCMNREYYRYKSGELVGDAYAAMYKAGADIKAKPWSVNKDASSFGLKCLGSKVNQAVVLMDLDEDPTTYKDVSLINDIVEEIKEISSPKDIGINEVKALILLDRFNEKFKNKKVDYNIKNVIKNLALSQKEDGSINNVPQHTAAALVVLNKHKDVEGVNDCITKALEYLHKSQREDGGILTSRSFNTKINSESVKYLIDAGEDLTSNKWIKNGKSSIGAIFTLWDAKSFKKSYGSTKDCYSIPKVLDALVSLKEAGYGNYVLKGVKFDNIQKEEPEKKKDGSSISVIIDGVIDYYNTEHFKTNQEQLVNFEYSAMYKAGADLKKRAWYLVEKYEPKYDKDFKYLGSKVNQSLILLDLDKDANNYENRNLINEIAEEVDNKESYFRQIDIKAVMAIDEYNEKFSDKKVNYNVKHAIEKILEAQCEDGGFKERGDSSIPLNVGYALMALSKHKDVEGVNEAISKASTYLHNIQKDDGGLYDKTFITGYHSEILRGLVAVGENPISKEWTKSSGKNPVDALFTLWKDNNCFDGKQGESINNRGWEEATWKALYALVDLKDAGYKDYVVDGVKIKGADSGSSEEKEKTLKVNVAIVMPKVGEYDCMFKPNEVTISDKKHDKGFTALGALQTATSLFMMQGDMVTSIYGYENKGLNGWMYTVNGVVPNEMAGKVPVKEGDKIIWYYSMSSMGGKAPTWQELTGEHEKTENLEIKNLTGVKEFKLDSDAQITVQALNNTKEAKNATLIVGLYDKKGTLVNYVAAKQSIEVGKNVQLDGIISLPKEGDYKVKAFIWNSLENMTPLSNVIQVPVK